MLFSTKRVMVASRWPTGRRLGLSADMAGLHTNSDKKTAVPSFAMMASPSSRRLSVLHIG